MLERPEGNDLLATARDVLLAEILPALPEEKRLAARMAASAIAIALRERQAMAEAWRGEIAHRLRAALGAPDAEGEAALLARLAAEIRQGRHDPGTPRHAEIGAMLRDLARSRCAVSAPKALK